MDSSQTNTLTLVTGGTGFLGRRLVERLLSAGRPVTVLGRTPAPDLEKRGVRFIRASLDDASAVTAACAGVSTVFHTAAKVGVWDATTIFTAPTCWAPAPCSPAPAPTASPASSTRARPASSTTAKPSPTPTNPSRSLPHARAPIRSPKPSPSAKSSPPTPPPFARSRSAHTSSGVSATRTSSPACSPVPAPAVCASLVTAKTPWTWFTSPTPSTPTSSPSKRSPALNFQLSTLNCRPLAAGLTSSPTANPFASGSGLTNSSPPSANRRSPKKISLGTASAIGAVCETAWRLLPLRGEPPMTRFIAAELAKDHWFNLAAARRDLGYTPRVTMAAGTAELVASLRAKN